jgi:nucleoside-diphosphate-sugar epimerase
MLHLVTGGSGFVGSNIARRLVARGERVRVLDIWKSNDLPDEVEFIYSDINDKDGLSNALRDVDYVHHNVALVPLDKAGEQYWQVNVLGTKLLLEESKKHEVKHISHMSSSAVFGSPEIMPIGNDTPRNVIEIYGAAKKAGEDLVIDAINNGASASVIRPRTVIGNGRLGIFGILFDWIQSGVDVLIIGGGNNLFQFAHVDDIADASINSCLGRHIGVFNIGALEFSTLRSDLEYLCEYANTGSKVRSLPIWVAVRTLQVMDKLRLSPLSPWHYLTYHKPFYFDSVKDFQTLQYSPAYSNRSMLIEAYDWYVKHRSESVSGLASSHKKPVKQRMLKALKFVLKFI